MAWRHSSWVKEPNQPFNDQQGYHAGADLSTIRGQPCLVRREDHSCGRESEVEW